MNRKPKVLVLGSLAMDMTVVGERFCNAGETIIGNGFSTAPGGKGANQAVQAARLGADVTMVGRVGNDDFGKALIRSVGDAGVNTEYIRITDGVPTGVADIQIQKNDKGTENRIVIIPGTNHKNTVEDVAFLKERIADYDIVIMQHEIPQEVNAALASYAKAAGVPVMLNPAPSAKVPTELISCLTYISPNEHEAADIVGISPDSDESITKAVAALHGMGVANVLITLGKNGCAYSDGKSTIHAPSVNMAPVVDPTAAGDSFIGAFCTAVSAGVEVEKALLFANCTAGITVSRMGAQTSLPTLEEVLDAMQSKGYDTAPYAVLR